MTGERLTTQGGLAGRSARISPLGVGDGSAGRKQRPCPASFVVPAFQAESTIRSCVESIRAAAPEGSEVIVVIDGSLDDTPALAAELADTVVHRPCQGGAARSRNDGAHLAHGDVLFFVDADVTVTPAAVSGALAHFEAGADAVFGAYTPLPPAEVANVATTYKNILHHYTHLCGERVAQTFWSGFGAIRRHAYEAVGGFDPAVTTGADVEDIHLGYRLRAAGFHITLDPSLQVQHHKRYTVGRIVSSDVFHRAVPWTRAMLQLQVISPDLNLRRRAMLASVAAYGAPLAAAAALAVGPGALGVATGLAGVWVGLNAGFLRYTRRHWSGRGMAASAGLLYLYSLYCPPGVALGMAVHLLRGRRTPRLNWLRLDPARGPAPELAVSLAVIATAGEPLAALAGLPDLEPWWELLVVSPTRPSELPAGARYVAASSPTATRNEMRQQALDLARGEMFATLDAGCVPDPGWLDEVRAAAAGAHVVVAGSFHHDRRSVRHRAAQVGRYFQWRPERPAAWVTDHPTTNAAFRREVVRSLGGFRDEGALLLRVAGFGARPVRFDPAMAVRLAGPAPMVFIIPGIGGVSRLRSAASSRYFDLSLASRLTLAGTAPLWGALALARLVRSAVAERSADQTFWLSLPLTAAATASHWAGRALGLLNPGYRGGLVPRTADDLAGLADVVATTERR